MALVIKVKKLKIKKKRMFKILIEKTKFILLFKYKEIKEIWLLIKKEI